MLKDFRGHQIEVGSNIVWPGRRGSSLWVTGGNVVKIETNRVTVVVTNVQDPMWDRHRLGTQVTLTRVDNIVVVK